MSYARFSSDSDVYVYFSVGDYLTCCGCSMAAKQDNGLYERMDFYDTQGMVDHILAHEERGDTVPPYLIADLWDDDRENFPGETT